MKYLKISTDTPPTIHGGGTTNFGNQTPTRRSTQRQLRLRICVCPQDDIPQLGLTGHACLWYFVWGNNTPLHFCVGLLVQISRHPRNQIFSH